ncbi:MarR family transcriptional regulator [Plantibacter sp. Leaf171]|jgi:DNA-binding MarR family transcriptional regulator|uniref:MarR family winged helix-turn-helix transcriptional regulator n=1 Tax=unclassified Plantibacter TaxID=2624265 RepID=UPI0006F7BA88|nr:MULTISPECIES: MarR family transcriptional regulator [unclassified Plantibacter]KQM16213.1 MarR family transcriptional regulator [Plantibacter sp. Leaf1]KQQ52316.1 MarR family transcriptional regulator [Plantibacter sp. Leaf314]KQR59348.1 MarR family transcriptional regulator [Plantibacter sp. Leaf171]
MTDTRWLSDAEQRDWVRFAAVLELLPAALDLQLTRDEHLTHFDYFTLAMLSEAPERTLRTSALAARTNATLPRLSRVLTRLEGEGFIARSPVLEDRRATNVTLTDAGWDKVVQAAPGHVGNVRSLVLDALSAEQVEQLGAISAALLTRLDPDGRMFASEA